MAVGLENKIVQYPDDATLVGVVKSPLMRNEATLSLSRDMERISEWSRTHRGISITSDTGRRLKTSKLIEAILEAQTTESIAENASAVILALNESARSKDLFEEEEEPVASEELISEIQFPEDLEEKVTSVVPDSKLKEDCVEPEPPNAEQKSTRKRKGTFDVNESSENDSSNGKKKGEHRRTGTYEVHEGDKLEDVAPAPKRRRTSTFEVNSISESQDADKKIAPKRRKTSTFDVTSTNESNDAIKNADVDKVQENSSHLEALRNNISNDAQVSVNSPSSSQNGSLPKLNLRSRSVVIKSKTKESTVSQTMEEDKLDPAPASETPDPAPASETPKPLRNEKRQSIRPTNPGSVRKSGSLPERLVTGTPIFSRKSGVIPAKSGTPTPSRSRKTEVTSQNLNKMTPNVSRKSGMVSVKLAAGTPNSSRKSGLGSGMLAAGTPNNSEKSGVVSTKLPNGTPKTEGKGQETSKIMKPLFNVGRGDAPAEDGKEARVAGSGIPRFVSFARKLKVPNFAKIHEKAFNRMEALDDYIDKKKKMFDHQSSATKKPRPRHASGEVFKPTVTSVENVSLNFAGNSAKSGKTPVGKSPKFNFGALKSPQTSHKVSKSAKKSPKSASKSQNTRLKSPKHLKSPKVKSPKHLKSPKVTSKKSPGASTVSKKVPLSARKSSFALKASPKAHHSNIPKPHKENVKPGFGPLATPAQVKATGIGNPAKTPGSSLKGKELNSKSSNKKPATTYVPYKGALKPRNTVDIHKTMSEKIPPVKTIKERREYQNKILKGVRFNKRFELQMAKRGIDITQ
ncbi:nucleolar protein dao-5-like [Macrobrachium nipponense]|uniref:nucleolar protein dao-5-like n=1 Tax=Macrobrachium nipponense TaxID=159736 RepID=UPI0030C7AC7E